LTQAILKSFSAVSKTNLSLKFASLIVLSLFASTSSIGVSIVHSEASTPSVQVFVWFFGYVGDSFYPQTTLGITQQEMLSAAANMQQALGPSRTLVFVSAVNQLSGQSINWKNSAAVSQIRNYVKNLSQYGLVYGRVDLNQFGYDTKTTVYKEVSILNNTLGLSGFWLDHAAVSYENNETEFNMMMQNLTTSFPNLTFILNQSTGVKKVGVIHPSSSSMTWNDSTYISPTVPINSYNTAPSKSNLQEFNKYFQGHVLLHYDSYSQQAHEPMGIFADQNSTNERSALLQLAQKGFKGQSQKPTAGYSLLYPILGAWTYGKSQYSGTLYNSLSIGTYSRSTISNFTSIMKEYP
jgi:hypothetical protein